MIFTKQKLILVLALLGAVLGGIFYAATPKEYEYSGQFEIGHVNRQHVFDIYEIQKTMEEFNQIQSEAKIRSFRTDQFIYTVKFRAKNPDSLKPSVTTFLGLFDKKFKSKYDAFVNPHHQELEELKNNRDQLLKVSSNFGKNNAHGLAETYYYFQIKSMITQFRSKQTEVEMMLSDDATRYFNFKPFEGESMISVAYPKALPSLAIGALIGLILGFVAVRLRAKN